MQKPKWTSTHHNICDVQNFKVDHRINMRQGDMHYPGVLETLAREA